jgi:hypothetical protein
MKLLEEIQSILEDLKVEAEKFQGSRKLKGKFPPISFLVNGNPKILKIKSIISLGGEFKNLYLLTLKNYLKDPKHRTFLAVSLASQSSDLLVSLAKDLIRDSNALKLIQYSLYTNTLRINLLLMIELDNIQSFSNAVEVLKVIRQDFRKKLDKISSLMEND